MDEIEIGFDEIKEGDKIRVVRTTEDLVTTLEGVAKCRDSDGDWLTSGDDLLTYQDTDEHEEEYFLLESGSLPTEPGSLLTWDNRAGSPVYALKSANAEGWYVAFPDGSNGNFSDLHVARKDWTQLN